MLDALNQAELAVLDFIQAHLRSDFLDFFFSTITRLADHGIFWIVLAVALLLYPKTRRIGLTMAFALIMGLVVGNLTLKPLVARIRPYDLNPGVDLLIERLHDYSFPSGHTLASFEGAGALMLWDWKRMGWPALILAVLIAFSRLYLYVHYPTDVLAGAVLGLLFAFLSYHLVRAIFRRLEARPRPDAPKAP